ncbi:hypothetical protein Goklo_016132 [Gossypium klotzschianum]|uniref:Uncharacterized protein n=1 Tax=Gossypium klotzschianum TaxID=34286 RepID=A0A7J8UDP8_9ROSI|nr:hypothetical protein [Gossypium klotzschianum]
MDNRLLIKEYDCCINWLEDAIRVLDKKATADLIKILRNSWNNRNNFIFWSKEDDTQVVQKLILMLRLTKTKQAMGLSLEMRMVLSLAVEGIQGRDVDRMG